MDECFYPDYSLHCSGSLTFHFQTGSTYAKHKDTKQHSSGGYHIPKERAETSDLLKTMKHFSQGLYLQNTQTYTRKK